MCGGAGQLDGWRFQHIIRNGPQYKTDELLNSGIFHVIFLDCGGWTEGN